VRGATGLTPAQLRRTWRLGHHAAAYCMLPASSQVPVVLPAHMAVIVDHTQLPAPPLCLQKRLWDVLHPGSRRRDHLWLSTCHVGGAVLLCLPARC